MSKQGKCRRVAIGLFCCVVYPAIVALVAASPNGIVAWIATVAFWVYVGVTLARR